MQTDNVWFVTVHQYPELCVLDSQCFDTCCNESFFVRSFRLFSLFCGCMNTEQQKIQSFSLLPSFALQNSIVCQFLSLMIMSVGRQLEGCNHSSIKHSSKLEASCSHVANVLTFLFRTHPGALGRPQQSLVI